MNPQTQFCHNPDCRTRGQVGQGNIRVHSHTEQRSRCTSCGQTVRRENGNDDSRWKRGRQRKE